MSSSNCLAFACLLYFRRRAKGKEAYLMFRRSRLAPFFHTLYAERRMNGTLRIVSYVPRHPRPKRLPPPLFSGRSKWGDL